MMKSKTHIKQGMQPLLSQHHPSSLFILLCYSLAVLNYVSLVSTQPHLLCHEDERSALLQFRQSFVLDCSETMVEDSFHSYSYKPKVASWNKHGSVKRNISSKDCCMWDGVRCDETTGHVIGLDLAQSCLYGSFPKNSSLFKLIHLQHLNLGANNFNYSLIPKGFGQLSNLISLKLSLSRFSGRVPLEISRLSNLRSLDISYSSGSFQYDDDKWLKLHNTHLETILNNLTRLNTLALDKVNVSSNIAPITSHLLNRTSLRWLGLASTNLIEFQPNHSSYKLRVLGLSGTRFSGKLPSSLGDRLINLRYLGLQDAIFTDTRKFHYNDVDEFSMIYKGTDTTYSENLVILQVIDLSSNNFTGKISDSIGDLVGLTGLNFSNNDLTGEVPSSLTNITGLEWLDLSHNDLYGKIPNELIQLTFLEVFNVSYNHLIGPIPHGKQFDTFDISSFEGNQRLCGDQLSKSCKDTDDNLPLSPPLPSNDLDWMDWIIRSLGYGSGLVIGIVGGIIFGNKHHEWLMELFGKRKRKRRVKITRRSNH